MKLRTELHRVTAEHFGEAVGDLKSVVDLNQLVGRGAGGRAVGVGESLGGEGHVASADGLAEVGVVAHETEVELIHHGRAERLCIAERQQLGAPGGEGVEAGNAGAALGDGIGIVEIELIDEVVGGEVSPARVGIEARAGLVVPDGLVVGRSGKGAGGRVGRGDVLQHALRRDRPGRLRDDGVGENAG